MFDEEAPKVIKFSHASKGHEFMVDTVLGPEEGTLTHKVFTEGEDEGEEPEEGEEGEEGAPKAEADILTSFKHCYVPEVVREPSIHFQKVPRLGSYMAIPLVYDSCLFEESL